MCGTGDGCVWWGLWIGDCVEFEEQMDKVTLWWRLNWTHVLVRRVVDGMLQVAENNVFDV